MWDWILWTYLDLVRDVLNYWPWLPLTLSVAGFLILIASLINYLFLEKLRRDIHYPRQQRTRKRWRDSGSRGDELD